MNGKKILVKLIWLFIGINSILMVYNFTIKYNEYRMSAERINNIKTVLEKQNIILSCDLPAKYDPQSTADLSFEGSSARYTVEKNFFGKDLVSVKHSVGKSKENPKSEEKVQYCTFNNEVLAFGKDTILYENQGVMDDNTGISYENAKRFCDTLINRIEPERKDAYKIEAVKKGNGWQLTYYQMLNKLPIYESSMTFEVCKDGVVSAAMHFGNVVVTSNDKKAIYPVDSVLFGLVDTIKAESVVRITDVSLVYKRVADNDDMWGQEIVPAYKVTFEGLDNPIFVNAYNNEIIR